MTPDTENTLPTRNYRIDLDVHENAQERARAEGTTLSTLIREWVSDYAAGRRRVGPGKPGNSVEVSRAELKQLRDLIDKILR